MRYELHRPGTAGVTPLVTDVEALDRPKPGRSDDRDEAILQLLREKLKDRDPEARKKAMEAATGGSGAEAGGEDKYEPQRLNRKIMWQYDSTARKVPLLRRNYI
jgi:hypothetical protein